jgi:hypothetical protein
VGRGAAIEIDTREVLSPSSSPNSLSPSSSSQNAASHRSPKGSPSSADRENDPVGARFKALAAMEPAGDLPVKNTFIEFPHPRPSWRRSDSMPDPQKRGSMSSTPSPPRDVYPGEAEDDVSALAERPSRRWPRGRLGGGGQPPEDDDSPPDSAEWSSRHSEPEQKFEDVEDLGASRRGSTATKVREKPEEKSSLEDLSNLRRALDTLKEQIPRDEDGNLTSVGSMKHHLKQCKPCVFIFSAGKVCANGIACEFCHFWHPQKKRWRASKRKRLERKNLELGNLNTQHDGQISQQEPEYDESVPDDSPRVWDDSARLDDNVSVDAPLMLDKLAKPFQYGAALNPTR